MKRSAWRLVAGALFLLLGLLVLLNLLLSGPSVNGSGSLGLFMAGLIPIVVGLGFLVSGLSSQRSSDAGGRGGQLDLIRNEIRWRAMAQGGSIAPGVVASQGGHELADVERAFLTMVAEGLAVAEPDDSGGIVYRITDQAAHG